MKCSLPFAITVLYVCAGLYCNAQIDTMSLKVVNVYDSVRLIERDQVSDQFDSVQYESGPGRDGGEFLQYNSALFIKDYGPGQPSVMSFRGSSAYHTRLFWEGMSVDNIMLGQSDLSLIQTGGNQSLEFIKSGNSLSLGPGGIGGILNVHSGTDLWSGQSEDVRIEAGSYNTTHTSLDVFKGFGKMKIEGTASHSNSDNNFDYVDHVNAGGVVQRENASYGKTQIIPKVSFRWKEKNTISATYWYAESNRRVASAASTAHGNATQTDRFNRLMLNFSHRSGKSNFSLKHAIMSDELNYFNELLSIVSLNRVISYKTLFTTKWLLSDKLSAETQLKADEYVVISNNYDGDQRQWNSGFFQNLIFLPKRGFASIGIRGDGWNNGKRAVMPSLNTGFYPSLKHKTLMLFFNMSRNVRFPTFNELFWLGSGNPDLKTEFSNSTEIGIQKKFYITRQLQSQINATGYYTVIENLIMWMPDGNGVWKPINHHSVRNSGIEAEAKVTYKGKAVKSNTSFNYIFTSSQINDGENTAIDGKQQIYVPYHKLSGRFHLEYRNFFIAYWQVLTSAIFISPDNRFTIPVSYPAGLAAGKKFNINRLQLSMYFKVNNLLNEDYQYVSQMPMPLRNYSFTIQLQSHK